MATNTKENGLETIMVAWLRDQNGYQELTTGAYDKDFALVNDWLESFLTTTQPEKVEQTMCFATPSEKLKFYTRLCDDITKRGITDVLRKGFKFNGRTFDMYYPMPSELNPSAKVAYDSNIFGVIRQLQYSKQNTNAIDVVIFVNGLPYATFELKNHYTGQTTDNAISQYQTDRDPNELLLKFKRCAVHMAVDDNQIFFCTCLKGKDSWFLPFNKGVNDGAGNPVVPNDTMTSYLWKEVLTKTSLSDIIENFAQITIREEKKKGKKTGKKIETVIWPRYHQLDVVRKLIDETQNNPIGQRFLIQHSAGSGKSNSISWLAYKLVTLLKEQQPIFDSVVVVTDRVNLDKQIRDNINSFKKLENIVGWADHSGSLSEMLTSGKQIIITTIHKFSFILDEIGGTLKNKRFAIIIDEAHSSQNGSMSANLSTSISGNAEQLNEDGEPEDFEDKVHRIIKGRKLATNANYYAFTATPKNKTLEMFGVAYMSEEGKLKHRPYHEYTMKQAIEEGFIRNVLECYTPFDSYYKVLKAIEDDPEFDKKKASGKIRAYIERQPETIRQKAQIMVEHFCTRVYMKIGGQARAMIVTSSIERAIDFFKAVTELLQERRSPYKAIVAFSDKEINGKMMTESMFNDFPSSEIEDRMEDDPYRILIVADKYQTGYDQPLLHTMYVDKQLSGLKAVQTLSRLNRCHPKKRDTFVLDFANDPEDIRAAFQTYYKTTILEGESDVNKLNDLTDDIEAVPFYTAEDLEQVVQLKLSGDDNDRPKIDAILDAVTERFKSELDENKQITAKSAIKNFNRAYPFFAAIMPFESPEWEKQYIFYSLLVYKLPRLKIDDFTQGLIETIDFDKYRIVKREECEIELEDADAQVNPVPVGQGKGKSDPEMELLSKIVEDFNKEFGNIDWKNADEVKRQIEELPARVAANEDFVNASRNGDSQIAQLVFNEAITRVVAAMLEEKTEFVEHYFNNHDFQNLVNARVYQAATSQVRAAV